MSPNNGVRSSGKWAKTRLCNEADKKKAIMESRQRDAETQAYFKQQQAMLVGKRHRKAERKAYLDFLRINGGVNGALLEGDYRSLAGCHFKVNEHGQREDVVPGQVALPFGQKWMPVWPVGENGKEFPWECGTTYQEQEYYRYQMVKIVDLAPLFLGYVQGPDRTDLAYQLKRLILHEVGPSLQDYTIVDEAYDPAREWHIVDGNGNLIIDMPAHYQPKLMDLPPLDVGLQEEAIPEPQPPFGDNNLFGPPEFVLNLPGTPVPFEEDDHFVAQANNEPEVQQYAWVKHAQEYNAPLPINNAGDAATLVDGMVNGATADYSLDPAQEAELRVGLPPFFFE
jgi:hypothetical protein